MPTRLVLLICLIGVVAIAHSATTAKRRTLPTTTSKAVARPSAYAYLRRVRGNRTCNTGSCPLWERHGRSFAALRCYSQEYRDCVCLHRMCYSSCLFTREICNQEMVSCLRQICPRCMPASALAMCSAYDSMAEKVADALSLFTCYACCPVMANQPGNATSMTTMAMASGGAGAGAGAAAGAVTTTPIVGLTETPAAGSTTVPADFPPEAVSTTVGVPVESTVPQLTESNANGAGLGTEPVPNGSPAPNRNQRVQATVRTTKRLVSTTRRPASTMKTNQVKNVPQASVKTTKKPQSSVRPKS